MLSLVNQHTVDEPVCVLKSIRLRRNITITILPTRFIAASLLPKSGLASIAATESDIKDHVVINELRKKIAKSVSSGGQRWRTPI